MGNKPEKGYTLIKNNESDYGSIEPTDNTLKCYQLVVEHGLDWPEFHSTVDYYGQGKYNDEIYDWIVAAVTNPEPVIIASLRQLISDHNYRPTYEYYSIPEPLSDPSTIGYKLVCCRMLNGNINLNICALLELAVDKIFHSTTGEPIALNQLKSGEKYCTDRVTVINASILGQTIDCIQAVKDLMNGKLRLVSNFDYKFIYELGQTICEPNFGKQGAGCVQGIHFFIDKQSAVKFIKTGFIHIDWFHPVATNKIESSDLKEILTVEARERYIYKKISEMKKQLSVLTPEYEKTLAINIQNYTLSYWSRHDICLNTVRQHYNIYRLGPIPSQIIN